MGDRIFYVAEDKRFSLQEPAAKPMTSVQYVIDGIVTERARRGNDGIKFSVAIWDHGNVAQQSFGAGQAATPGEFIHDGASSKSDRDALLQACRENGVSHLILAGCNVANDSMLGQAGRGSAFLQMMADEGGMFVSGFAKQVLWCPDGAFGIEIGGRLVAKHPAITPY